MNSIYIVKTNDVVEVVETRMGSSTSQPSTTWQTFSLHRLVDVFLQVFERPVIPTSGLQKAAQLIIAIEGAREIINNEYMFYYDDDTDLDSVKKAYMDLKAAMMQSTEVLFG